jgi:cytochrome c biogenesis protein CcdA
VEDLILNIILAILEIVWEAVGEYLLAAIWDLLLRVVGEVFNTSEAPSPVLASFGYIFLGLLTGGLSLLFLPHRMIRHSRIPGASLIIGPLITGFMMSATGSFLRQRNKRVTRIESFGYGFAFALGVALVRFFWAK